jgi:site-specific recombinase XerD
LRRLTRVRLSHKVGYPREIPVAAQPPRMTMVDRAAPAPDASPEPVRPRSPVPATISAAVATPSGCSGDASGVSESLDPVVIEPELEDEKDEEEEEAEALAALDAIVFDDQAEELELAATPFVAPVPSAAPLPADRNPALVYLASYGKATTRRTMTFALIRIAALLGTREFATVPWHLLRFQHTSALRARMEEWPPATANLCIIALRGVIKTAWKLGLMTGDDYQRAHDIGSMKGSRVVRGRHLSPSEIKALFDACDLGTAKGARDAALLAILRGAGPRRFEACGASLAAYNRMSGEIRVVGKGNKERTLVLPAGSVEAVNHWLRVRGEAPGPLLSALTKGGHVTMRPLSGSAIWAICRDVGERAGVADFSPHDFRRTLAGDLLDTGADIVTVRDVLGHESVHTTQRYDRRPEHAKKRAVQSIHVPFSPPKTPEPVSAKLELELRRKAKEST